jgi:hypothetical protein
MSSINNGPQIVKSNLVLDLDAGYIRSYSPNVYPNPTDIFAWAGQFGANAATLSRDPTMTRQYGSIPMKMAVTGTDPFTNTINYGPGASSTWNLAPAANGQTWTVSVYVKASVATTGELFLMPADSNGIAITSAAGSVTITTSWTRVSFTYTISSANCAFIQSRLDGTPSGGSGINIWWDGWQVERASSATTFNPYYFGNTVWRDTSGNSNNGTLTNGPLFNSGNKGSILFDGSDDTITTNLPLTNFPSYSSFTFETWVRISAYPAVLAANAYGVTYQCGVLMGATAYCGVALYWYGNASGNAFTLYGYIRGADAYRSTSGYNFSLNQWYHCVLVNNAALGTIALFINGSLYNSTSTATLPYDNTLTSSAGNIGISKSQVDGGGTANYKAFGGQMASARIYNRALTNAEITQNYEATRTRFGL